MEAPHHVFDFATLAPRDRYKLLCGIVVPRPIALVTSCDEKGRVNAAPFSFFNVFSEDPAQIVLGLQHRPDGSPKDTTRNLNAGRAFTVHLVDEPLAETMNACAIDFPVGVSEVEALAIPTCPGIHSSVPRIAAAPFALECRATMSLVFSPTRELLIGEVLGIIARADLVDAERLHIDSSRYRPIGRLAGHQYARQGEVFEMAREPYATWAARHGQAAGS
jgi:flavin reductase (DIM6/NTAB) family NADH-FMN oxidoreductase RutF